MTKRRELSTSSNSADPGATAPATSDKRVSLAYRPAIDGLRAIAVLSVFVYHLNEEWLGGGFVGVDVFFVISGYLITSIIASEIEADSFSFRKFFLRRISRIAPMAFLVSTVILVVSSTIYGPEDLGAIATGGAAAALSLANVKFALQGSYFAFFPDTQPFLHYWSLSVEEQFYLIFPLLLCFAFGRHRNRRRALLVTCIVGVISLCLCLAFTPRSPAFAFYLLPFRAWELLAGSILALAGSKTSRISSPILSIGQPIGLAIILASVATIPNGDSFPGWYALLPVTGTVLAIACHHSTFENLLAQAWLVKVGKYSYSLYLWHWPVFCFVDYSLFMQPEGLRLPIKILASIILTIATYHFFENPIRFRLNNSGSARLTYAGFAAVVTLTVSCGFRIRSENFNNVNTSLERVAAGGEAFWFSDNGPRVIVAGDSNAGMYGRVLVELAKESGLRLNVVSVPGANAFPGSKLWAQTTKFIDSIEPDAVIFIASWGPKRKSYEETGRDLCRYFNSSKIPFITIHQPPLLPKGVSRKSIRRDGIHKYLEADKDRIDRGWVNSSLSSARISAKVIPVDDLFTNQDGSIRFVDQFGHELYRDRTHLSHAGASLVKPRLKAAIMEAITNDTGALRLSSQSLCK